MPSEEGKRCTNYTLLKHRSQDKKKTNTKLYSYLLSFGHGMCGIQEWMCQDHSGREVWNGFGPPDRGLSKVGVRPIIVCLILKAISLGSQIAGNSMSIHLSSYSDNIARFSHMKCEKIAITGVWMVLYHSMWLSKTKKNKLSP